MEWRGSETHLLNGVLKFGREYDVVVTGSTGSLAFTVFEKENAIGSVHYRDLESAFRKWKPAGA